MIQIPLSAVVAIAGSAEAFTAAVAAQRDELEAHRRGKPGIAAPLHHELIDQLVQRIPDTGPVAERKPDQFVVAPFEIIDDTPPPPPPPTLAERKVVLLQSLYTAVAAARDAVLSPARLQLLNLDVTDALVIVEEKRSPAQLKAIELLTAYDSRSSDIARAAARAMVDIEDLTEASIDRYQLPAF